MKTGLPALLLTGGFCLTSPRSLLLCLPLMCLSPARGGEHVRALEDIMDCPGWWGQMCGAGSPVPFDAPIRLFSSRLAPGIFDLAEPEMHMLQAHRAEFLAKLLPALQTMDLTRPPDLARQPGDRSGFKLAWLNSVHLEVVRVLNASEALPDLLRLENQLCTLLETFAADPKSFLPPLYIDTRGKFEKPGTDPYASVDWDSPEYKRDLALFTCRVYQRELLGTVTLLLRQEDFAPARTDFVALQKQEFAQRSAALNEVLASGEKKHNELEARVVEARARADSDTVSKLLLDATPSESRRHLTEERLKDLTADEKGIAFDATYSASLRAQIRIMAESFLKTVPPERRRGAAGMPPVQKSKVAVIPSPPPPPQHQGPNTHILILAPAAAYKLGADDVRTNPPHTVTLKAFAIAETETTNAQFAAFVKATNYKTSAETDGGMTFQEGMWDWEWHKDPDANWRHPFGKKGPSAEENPSHPVTQISGADALAYCKWIGARLPTLDEWEAAARAGAATKYPWGQDYDPKRANVWNGPTHLADTKLDGFLYTAPVKSFPPNAWGLYDVIGNVFEYCDGLPVWMNPEESRRIISGRGGSWWCSADTCSFFNLQDIGSMDRHGSLANQGFRIAFDAEKAAAFALIKPKPAPAPSGESQRNPASGAPQSP